ncbi:uncharacterized protein LOC124655116 [Lolium rigidum]|uniref:uncharacterized protein LOC124655116 n=1 Tax=Lolium rigidum TaxID=89674 RepID=UPI001F5E32B6|nr:uncharacterized protein LOC124655116 [Lolium rigidum]
MDGGVQKKHRSFDETQPTGTLSMRLSCGSPRSTMLILVHFNDVLLCPISSDIMRESSLRPARSFDETQPTGTLSMRLSCGSPRSTMLILVHFNDVLLCPISSDIMRESSLRPASIAIL